MVQKFHNLELQGKEDSIKKLKGEMALLKQRVVEIEKANEVKNVYDSNFNASSFIIIF